MRAVVLDGSSRPGDAVAAAAACAARDLGRRGIEAGVVTTRHLSVAPCVGCFRCWYETPGVCAIADDAQGVTKSIITADLVVVVSPVTYGGYGSGVKVVLDRSIGLVSPLCMVVAGETRHVPRYERFPALAVLGIQAAPDEAEAAVFECLAHRNAVNLHAPSLVVDVPAVGTRTAGRAAWHDAVEARVAAAMADAVEGVSAAAVGVAAPWCERLPPSVAGPAVPPPATALIVIGSPRTRRSTSAALGAYLADALEAAGVVVETASVREALSERGGARRLVRSMQAAELVVVFSPLYVDSLPAPLTRVMELVGRAGPAGGRGLGRDRATVESPDATAGGLRRGPRLAAVINSGFPEAVQSDTAIALCATFARRVGMSWAGGLRLGGGAALDGRALDGAGERFADCRRALDLAASALAAGEEVPTAAVDSMARPAVPFATYRDSVDGTFRELARTRGVDGRLFDRPYDRRGGAEER